MMDNLAVVKLDDEIVLPPGFRFHPTDEELITHYLSKKVVDANFSATAIGEVDMNKIEPWDLPRMAKLGEKEWYFFCVRDKKYPTGLRTNRATTAGYWKATGKDKDIFRGKSLVGMKKTLVFYKGRAPKGEKTNWVIHEYRLDGQFSFQNLPKNIKNEWVICRVFHKSSGGKKVDMSGLMSSSSSQDEMPSTAPLPQLMDSSVNAVKESSLLHVPCFSNTTDVQKKEMITYFTNSVYSFPSNAPSDIVQRISHSNSYYSTPFSGNLQYPAAFVMQDQALLKGIWENYDNNMRQILKSDKEMGSVSQETGLSTEMNTEISSNLEMGNTSVGAVNMDCLWSY